MYIKAKGTPIQTIRSKIRKVLRDEMELKIVTLPTSGYVEERSSIGYEPIEYTRTSPTIIKQEKIKALPGFLFFKLLIIAQIKNRLHRVIINISISLSIVRATI